MNPAAAVAAAAPSVVPGRAEEDKVKRVADALLDRTRHEAARHPQTRGAVLGGSFAKGTWLHDNVDLDVFVKFDPSTGADEFERIGLAIGAEATRGFPGGKMYAQHPYTEATVDGIRVNVVPCYDVPKGAWKSAADRSPYHIELVGALSEKKKLEVRLLKRFMAVAGVYGAEIERQGFSGYVAEVLVMAHGDALGALRWFARLPIPEGKPFTLADPVDSHRDLGTAVSAQSLGRMVLAAREFLRRPSPAFFRKMERKARSGLRREVVALAFAHAPLSEDTLWGELRKTTKHVVRHLEVSGFSVARSMAASNDRDRSAILLIPVSSTLSRLEQRVGPTVDREADVKAFVGDAAKGSMLSWVDEDARVRVLKKRRYTKLDSLLRDMAKGAAGPIGLSKELGAGIRKSGRVLGGSALREAAASAPWLEQGIREITTDVVGTG